jgi:cell division septum initiation protein DivIVA
MTKDEIVQRSFAAKGRGLSESDVRSFLKRVADEVERLGKREDELIAKIKQMEADAQSRPKATKQELLEALGEQTTRVLSSAEEAAEEMLSEAREETGALRENTKKETEEMLAQARAQRDETLSEIQSRVKALQESADRDAQTVVEQARAQGREIFQESVVVREQILKDLLRRRDLLLEQIDELRKGREELLESYKVVKGSFQKATDALHEVEEKASSELLTNPIDVDALLKSPVELPSVLETGQPMPKLDDVAPTSSAVTAPEAEKSEKPEAKIEEKTESNEDESDIPSITGKQKGLKKYVKDAFGVGKESTTDNTSEADEEIDIEESVTPIAKTAHSATVSTVAKKKDVGALFQSLKEQKPEASQAKAEKENKNEKVKAEVKNEIPVAQKGSKKKSAKEKSPLDIRDDALNNVSSSILRKAKRQLQDEQNELLDTLRTIKPKKHVSSENILNDDQTHVKTWEEVIRPDLVMVFNAGAKSVSKSTHEFDEDALRGAVTYIVTPLRETLARAIDEGDQEEASTRVGARYREWRNTELKNALNDAMCCAYNAGVVAAAPSDATITWVGHEVEKCPDCADNTLEPTQVGEKFPTGQVAPPAHSGCRCVITVA